MQRPTLAAGPSGVNAGICDYVGPTLIRVVVYGFFEGSNPNRLPARSDLIRFGRAKSNQSRAP